MDDIGEDWHEGMISLPLVTMLIDDILELSVVKDIKSLNSSIHEILTVLSHIILERKDLHRTCSSCSMSCSEWE